MSMIRCPQALHLSADCWKPEYCNRPERREFHLTTSNHGLARAFNLAILITKSQHRGTFWLANKNKFHAHQKVFFTEYLPTHVVKCLSSQPSTCRESFTNSLRRYKYKTNKCSLSANIILLIRQENASQCSRASLESRATQLQAKTVTINHYHSKVMDALTIFIISCWIPGR